MGASGVGVFQDDVAADVRTEYLDLLADGASDADAFQTIVRQWEGTIADSDDGPVFWLALAATQSQYGRLHSRAKSEALKVIDQGKGLDRWTDAGLTKKRLAVLAQLKKKLLAPQPKKRTPRLRTVPEVPSTTLTSPDGKATATAFQLDPTQPFSQICITMKVKRTEGGGSVFVAHCDVADIKLQWLDADMLRITYPKQAKVAEQNSTGFFYGRTIAVRYRRV